MKLRVELDLPGTWEPNFLNGAAVHLAPGEALIKPGMVLKPSADIAGRDLSASDNDQLGEVVDAYRVNDRLVLTIELDEEVIWREEQGGDE